MTVRVPAWHNLGKVLETHPDSLAEAFKIAGLDYQILKYPMVAQLGEGLTLPVDGRMVLVRTPTLDDPVHRSLGVVSDKYEPLQNDDIAEIVDSLGLPKKWKIETVGALGQGETVFAAFLDGEHDVADIESEKLKMYFTMIEQRDGKSAFKLIFTPVRVVCQNTLTLGLAEAITTVNVAHLRGGKNKIEDRVKLMTGLDKSVKSSLDLFDKFAAFGITEKEAMDIIASAYPKPVKPKRLRQAEEIVVTEPSYNVSTEFAGLNLSEAWATDTLTIIGSSWERESARVETLRSQALDLFRRFNDEQPKVANTAWGAINAVVENEDFRDGPEGMFESTLWGQRQRTKARATKAVLEMMV